MMIDIFIWWLIPAICVWAIFRVLVALDDLTLDDVDDFAFGLMVALSVFWPVGVVALVAIVGEGIVKKLRNQ